MKIDANIVITFGRDGMSIEIKSLVKEALKKGVLAVAKLVKTKLFPKAEEKYCRALQATSEKLINKASKLVKNILEEKDEKKKTRELFVLQLCVNTMEAIHEAFGTALDTIKATVSFVPLMTTEGQQVIAEAVADAGGKVEEEYDNYIASLDTGCGPDGCEIV